MINITFFHATREDAYERGAPSPTLFAFRRNRILRVAPRLATTFETRSQKYVGIYRIALQIVS